MSRFYFLRRFVSNPRGVGSVTPSSRWLCRRLLRSADLSRCECVVEFGPGTACLTRMILDGLPSSARLVAFEIDEGFVRLLRRELVHPRLHLIHGSAEHVEEHLRRLGIEGADYIFSGLPFTAMPARLRERILRSANRALKPSGKFIIYQYSPYLLRALQTHFGKVRVGFELRNIPPAFCFVCSKRA